MPVRRDLAEPSNLMYLYDGGLKGFYTCVFESVYSRELPLAVTPGELAQPTLLPQRWIETDDEKAGRVRRAIAQKIDRRAQELVETVFLSCLPDKELPLLRFLLMGFRDGRVALRRLDHPDVATLMKAENHLLHEAHVLTGFVRFSDVEGRLIATIRPKNFVLPFLAEHFAMRLSEEVFLIYDRTNRAALMHEGGRVQIVPMEEPPAFEADSEERMYRMLWKQFYNTVSIKSRENHRCRMNHLPKRFWSEMTEMREML